MVYVTGDTHGEIDRFSDPQIKRLKKGDTLIICGDFGFLWDGSEKEKKELKQLGKKKYNIAFIDGTHENFDLLNSYEVTEWHGGKVHNICGNLYHLMRGQIFEIDGIKIFAMGGGESPDREMRSGNENWWRDEIPNKNELVEGANNIDASHCCVDVIVTHEPPAKMKGFLKLQSYENVRITALNSYFEQLNSICEYTKWFFGSLHQDKIITKNNIAVFKNVLPAVTPDDERHVPIRKS